MAAVRQTEVRHDHGGEETGDQGTARSHLRGAARTRRDRTGGNHAGASEGRRTERQDPARGRGIPSALQRVPGSEVRMKAVAISVWSNVNGWHWTIDMDECELSSGMSHATQDLAERDMRVKADKFGIDLDGIEIDLGN
jgi:hypothetical protein